jgi:hypothetical protein
MDPDKALAEIRRLIATTGGELDTDTAMEICVKFGQLDEWLIKGGLFPAAWEDTHGWVRNRRDLADKQRELTKVEEMLHSAQRAVDQLEARAEQAREVCRKHNAVMPPRHQLLSNQVLARLDGAVRDVP